MYFRRPLQSLLLRYSAENLHVTKFWYVLSVPAKIIFLKWTVFVFTQSWSRDQQMQRTYRVSTIQFQLCSKWIHRKLIHRLRICLRICFRFGKVFIVTHAISFFFSNLFSRFCLKWLLPSAKDLPACSRNWSIPPHVRKILWWAGYGSIQRCLNVWFSIVAMKMLAKAMAIFVSWLFHGSVGSCYRIVYFS